MNAVTGVLQDKLPQLKRAAKVYLAYSGGLDSSVLFHALLDARVPFCAVHVNHQLSAKAGNWQEFCEREAQQHRVPIKVYKITVEKQGRGLEDAARNARYKIFEDLLGKNEILLSAHHANDQAETFLYRLVRGSGLTGLSAMAECRRLGKGQLLRPLLRLSRDKIQAYADAQKLQWVEDESNQNTEFDRNFIRADLLPVILQRWPSALTNIANSASLAAKETALLREYAALDYQICKPQRERQGESLDIDLLQTISEARRHNILRYWLRHLGYGSLGLKQLEGAREIIEARVDAVPELIATRWCLRRYGKRLYLLPPQKDAMPEALAWDARTPAVLSDGARFSLLEGAPLDFELRFREGGERCQPIERQHSQTLKKLLQEYRLEPWWRDQVPLVYYQRELFAVGDLFVCEAGQGYRFGWQLPS